MQDFHDYLMTVNRASLVMLAEERLITSSLASAIAKAIVDVCMGRHPKICRSRKWILYIEI